MPEHIRALIIILGLASIVFALARAPLCATLMTKEDFVRRRNLWFTVTLIAFLAHNFWVYIIAVGVVLWRATKREPNRLALYFLLLFAVPPIDVAIGGAGVVEQLFSIDYIRLLALAILLPTWVDLRQRKDVPRFGTFATDKLLAIYLVLLLVLRFRGGTTTDSLRYGFYLFTDAFLPYYVASRALRHVDQFREALGVFVLSAMLLAMIGMFEFAQHWLLYKSLDEALGVYWGGGGNYLGRGTSLRALASTGHPLVLGHIMVVALGFYAFLRRSIPGRWRWLGLALLLGGLLAPMSRGPWMGAALLPVVFALMSDRPARNIMNLSVGVLVVGTVILVSPLGASVIDHLPFVGTVDAENVTYRQRLIDNSLIVIAQKPWFGWVDALATPEMEEMRQGQGIIDIVNSYIAVGLGAGLIGLALFVGIFVSMFWLVYRRMSHLPSKVDPRYLLGQSLLSITLAILLLIGTVSSILAIATVNWLIVGLGIAYVAVFAKDVTKDVKLAT